MKEKWRTAALLGGVIAVLLTGCSETSAGGRTAPATPVSVPPTGSRPTAEPVEALATYRAMWKDLALASETSDAASPLLSSHATGGALELLKYGLAKSKKEGVVSKGAPLVDPKVVSATDQKVVLVDCVDDTHWLLYKPNGQPKDNVPGGHLKTDATVQRARAAWKVTDLYMHETGSC